MVYQILEKFIRYGFNKKSIPLKNFYNNRKIDFFLKGNY